jgi:peptidoglycan hydrolase CwlO-like protein
MSEPKIFDSLLHGAGSIIASFSVALGLATLNTINSVSHEMVRLQEQVAGIKSELSDIRGDFDKQIKVQGDQIKSLSERIDRLEGKDFKPQSRINSQELTLVTHNARSRYSCRVCRERGGCRVTTCSDPN